jgi:aldehyde dehydrogenase (NAD+)
MRSLAYDELFIGGRWQAPSTGQRLTVISPHTEEPIGETPEASPEDVDKAGAAARKAFDDGPWPRLNPFELMEKIEKLAAVYSGHMDEMADLITAEMGSPRSFSRLGQAAGAASQMHLTWRRRANFPGSKGDRACSATFMCAAPPLASSAPSCRGTCLSS